MGTLHLSSGRTHMHAGSHAPGCRVSQPRDRCRLFWLGARIIFPLFPVAGHYTRLHRLTTRRARPGHARSQMLFSCNSHTYMPQHMKLNRHTPGMLSHHGWPVRFSFCQYARFHATACVNHSPSVGQNFPGWTTPRSDAWDPDSCETSI